MYIADVSQPFRPLSIEGGLPLPLFNALSLGVSLFTTLRSNTPYCWQRAHLKRLHSQALQEKWPLPHFREFAAWLQPALTTAFETAGTWRITLVPQISGTGSFYRDAPPLHTLTCLLHKRGNLFPISRTLPAPQGTLHVQPYKHPAATSKHGSQWGSLHLRKIIAVTGDDVLWQNGQGHLTECTHANWFTHHGELGWLLPLSHEALAGITLQQVRKAFQTVGVSYTECAIPLEYLPDLTLAFTSNSGQGLSPVEALRHEGCTYPLKPTSQILQEATHLYQAWYDIAFKENNHCYL
jgi:branched-subunit amino acid aminotransferase/4-amino-4-deoxychorismate lyase